MTKDRLLWVDVLNIVACVCVVWMHCTNSALHNFNGEVDIPYIIGLITHTIAYWPVPVFMMLSGYKLLSNGGGMKDFYIRRIKRIGIPFIAWSLFYYIVNYHRLIPLNEFTEKFLAGRFCGTMWFFIPLFTFYLCFPFIQTFVQNASSKMMRDYLWIGFFFVSLFPCVLNICEINYTNIFPIGMNYLLVAIAGYVMATDKWFKEHRRKIIAIGMCSTLIHVAVLTLTTYHFHLSSKVWLNATYPTNLLISASVYMLFSGICWNRIIKVVHISRDKLFRVSTCSFGIYLIHPFIISVSHKLHIGLDNPYIGFLIVYLISLSIIILLKKIPLVKILVP